MPTLEKLKSGTALISTSALHPLLKQDEAGRFSRLKCPRLKERKGEAASVVLRPTFQIGRVSRPLPPSRLFSLLFSQNGV